MTIGSKVQWDEGKRKERKTESVKEDNILLVMSREGTCLCRFQFRRQTINLSLQRERWMKKIGWTEEQSKENNARTKGSRRLMVSARRSEEQMSHRRGGMRNERWGNRVESGVD